MKCDIIIPVWNQLEYTRDCVRAILKNTKYPYRLILVDNASDAKTKRYLEGLRDGSLLELELIRNERNLGFVKAVNQALKVTSAPYVCVLNNDTIPGPGWLERMIEFAGRHPDIGLMNPLCSGHGGRTIDEYAAIVANNKDEYMEMNQCQGFCMLMRRDLIEKVGLFDEAFGMGCYDDTDYSMRAWKAGYRCASIHSSYVYHRENASFDALGRRKVHEDEGERTFLKKWPRHLRAAVSFNAEDNESGAEGMLKAALCLAREWCWVNVFIFGGAVSAKALIKNAAGRINMPRHQNIKLNFLPASLIGLQLLARVLERSFGLRARKRYDLIIADRGVGMSLLKASALFHKARVTAADFNKGADGDVKVLIGSIRNTEICAAT